MKIKYRIICFVLIPLLIGGIIYILFRSDNLTMFNWFNTLGLATIIDMWRQTTIGHINLPAYLVFSVPDALWIFAFTNLMLIIWQDRLSKNSIFWIMLAPTIGIFSELGQIFKIIPGTFDIIDLTLILIATSVPILQTIKKQKLENL